MVLILGIVSSVTSQNVWQQYRIDYAAAMSSPELFVSVGGNNKEMIVFAFKNIPDNLVTVELCKNFIKEAEWVSWNNVFNEILFTQVCFLQIKRCYNLSDIKYIVDH